MKPDFNFYHSGIVCKFIQLYIVYFNTKIFHLNSHIIHYLQKFVIQIVNFCEEIDHEHNASDIEAHYNNTDLFLVNSVLY